MEGATCIVYLNFVNSNIFVAFFASRNFKEEWICIIFGVRGSVRFEERIVFLLSLAFIILQNSKDLYKMHK